MAMPGSAIALGAVDTLAAQHGGLTTTLDIAALASALVWPILLVFMIWLLRDRLVELAKLLVPHLKSLSVGMVSVEFAEARPLPLQLLGAVDLRHAGQSQDVNDSTLRSFYDQISDPTELDYAVVDLGTGEEWLTSRLFVLAVILSRMRSLRALVFVETAAGVRRRLVGYSECTDVRWRFATRFPWLEAALVHAEASVWPSPVPGLTTYAGGPRIVNDHGRFELLPGGPEPAAQLLRAFLNAIQADATPALQPDGWVTLPGSTPPRAEHGHWLSAAELEQIMGAALNPSSIKLRDLECRSEAVRACLLLRQKGRWISVTRHDHVFDRLIDRWSIVDKVAQNCVEASTSA